MIIVNSQPLSSFLGKEQTGQGSELPEVKTASAKPRMLSLISAIVLLCDFIGHDLFLAFLISQREINNICLP